MGIIENRRSIRRFTDEPVCRETLERIVRAGMHAANAYGTRPWQFLVLTERENIDRAAAVNPNCSPAKNAAALIIPLYDPQREHKKSDWWMEDMSACAQNILLKITEEGLGGVWLGICPREDRMDYLKREFNIPEQLIPFCIIALGHPAEQGDTEDREDSKVVFERYE